MTNFNPGYFRLCWAPNLRSEMGSALESQSPTNPALRNVRVTAVGYYCPATMVDSVFILNSWVSVNS